MQQEKGKLHMAETQTNQKNIQIDMPTDQTLINDFDRQETFRVISKSLSELKIKGEHIENNSKQDSNENESNNFKIK